MQKYLNTLLVAIGAIAIVFAMLSYLTNMQLADIFTWISAHFGITFCVLFIALILVSLHAIVRFSNTSKQAVFEYWQEVAQQCANGISTLALTFTLLGISLGIGALSEQSLSPDNVNNVISILTTQFSMAFMTTVVGLPTATALRAWISIIYTKKRREFSLD